MSLSKKNKEKAAKEISKEILNRTRQMFAFHKTKVERLNQQKNFGGLSNKNDKSQTMYASLSDLSKDIRQLAKRVKACDKLRKQRRQLFERKLTMFADTLDILTKKKNIKVKLNEHILNLIQQTKNIIEEGSSNLKNFQKEANVFCCGKSYDFKPAVERSMLQLAESGFLWANIGKFQSVTNDSVKQIFFPVEYDQNVFRNIENEVLRLWPEPQLIEQEVKVKVPEIIKDRSQLQLAHQLLFGFLRPQDIPKAMQIYMKQSQKSPPQTGALNALGTIFEEGKYANRDIKKSINYFKISAKNNDPEGLYKIGQFLEKGTINSKEFFDGLYANRQAQIRGGIQYYQKAAKLGHLDAITDLGFIYQKGILNQSGNEYYIEPNPQVAQKYYLKAKKEEFPRAYNNLGSLYISNESLVEEAQNSNLEKGIKYLEKATQLKYPKAFINLGKCYLNGVGVTQSVQKARSLFLQGSELGDVQSGLQLIKTYLGTSLDQDKTIMKLVDITRQILLVDKNNAQALYFMGLFEEKGIGVHPNKQSSFFYISQSARLGYPPAMTKLGDYYYSGYHVEKDYEFAQKLYQKAAEKQNSQALVNIGVMIEKGILQKDADPQKATQYYKEAAKMGNTNAILLLGLKQKNQSPEIGNQTIMKAAEMGNIDAIKILNKTTNRLIPKHSKQKTTYNQAMKKMSAVFLKEMSEGQSSTLRNNFLIQ